MKNMQKLKKISIILLSVLLIVCFIGCTSDKTYPTDEAGIIKRLKNVSGIIEIESVTEETDPNQILGKPDAYTAAVYFSYDQIDQGEYTGSLIEDGVIRGGKIELYPTHEGAIYRDNYLSALGAAFGGHYHTVLNTMVIRTSKKLTSTQHEELEKKIISAMTKAK